MSASCTVRRNGRIHFRVRIPLDLIELVGRSELHRSLSCADTRQARSFARTLRTQVDNAFASIRHQRALGASHGDLLAAARALYAETLPKARPTRIIRAAYGDTGGNKAPGSLREAVKAFVSDRAGRWTTKTKLMHAASLDLFVQLVGNKPLPTITRQDCRSARDLICRLPPNLTKRYPGVPLRELADRGLPPMSPKTVNRNLSAVTAMFSWCVREGLIPDHPARGLLVQIKRRPDLERDAFSLDQLRVLFAALEGEKGARYWLPRIGLYSGMRLEEIAQLRPQDIREVGGVWCFDVNGDAGKKLKTAGSARLVPVHPKLIEAGLLAYTDNRGDATALWPDLRRGGDGFLSSPFSKWFGRFKKKAGITNRKLTFHSLRHTFVDALKQLGEDELVIRELVGHANPSITTGRYGKRLSPQRLFEAIANVEPR